MVMDPLPAPRDPDACGSSARRDQHGKHAWPSPRARGAGRQQRPALEQRTLLAVTSITPQFPTRRPLLDITAIDMPIRPARIDLNGPGSVRRATARRNRFEYAGTPQLRCQNCIGTQGQVTSATLGIGRSAERDSNYTAFDNTPSRGRCANSFAMEPMPRRCRIPSFIHRPVGAWRPTIRSQCRSWLKWRKMPSGRDYGAVSTTHAHSAPSVAN